MAVCFTERELIQKASQTCKQHSWLNDTGRIMTSKTNHKAKPNDKEQNSGRWTHKGKYQSSPRCILNDRFGCCGSPPLVRAIRQDHSKKVCKITVGFQHTICKPTHQIKAETESSWLYCAEKAYLNYIPVTHNTNQLQQRERTRVKEWAKASRCLI